MQETGALISKVLALDLTPYPNHWSVPILILAENCPYVTSCYLKITSLKLYYCFYFWPFWLCFYCVLRITYLYNPVRITVKIENTLSVDLRLFQTSFCLSLSSLSQNGVQLLDCLREAGFWLLGNEVAPVWCVERGAGQCGRSTCSSSSSMPLLTLPTWLCWALTFVVRSAGRFSAGCKLFLMLGNHYCTPKNKRWTLFERYVRVDSTSI